MRACVAWYDFWLAHLSCVPGSLKHASQRQMKIRQQKSIAATKNGVNAHVQRVNDNNGVAAVGMTPFSPNRRERVTDDGVGMGLLCLVAGHGRVDVIARRDVRDSVRFLYLYLSSLLAPLSLGAYCAYTALRHLSRRIFVPRLPAAATLLRCWAAAGAFLRCCV